MTGLVEARLESMTGKHEDFYATVTRSGKPAKKPKLNNDGSIPNTTLQWHLKLKIGAPVMLTHNVDVMDSLTNGTMGHVVGFESAGNCIKRILVQFDNIKAGQQKRKKNSAYLQNKFPNIPVTPISKVECRLNLSKMVS